MKSAVFSTVLFAASAMAQTFMLNTPTGPTQCQPILITWTAGGTPPFFLSVLPANQPNAQPLEQYTGLTGSSFTWNTNIQGGTQVGMTLRDSTGASSSTAPFGINTSGDSSCLSSPSGGGVSTTSGSGSSTSGSASTTSAGGSSTTTVPGASTTAATTSSVSTPAGTTTTKPASSSTTSSAPSTSSSGSASGGSSNGAVSKVASAGVAALVGGFVAAVLA